MNDEEIKKVIINHYSYDEGYKVGWNSALTFVRCWFPEEIHTHRCCKDKLFNSLKQARK